jgi:hypothetical protein
MAHQTQWSTLLTGKTPFFFATLHSGRLKYTWHYELNEKKKFQVSRPDESNNPNSYWSNHG